jgi:4-hydroxybenzoate polyprenyltransferase
MKQTIIAFLKLVRWFHLLLAVLPFFGLFLVIQHYAPQNISACKFSTVDFCLLCFSVQLLFAAGCVLNDIMDRHIDKINKPKTHIINNTISLKAAKQIFVIITIMIVAIAYYISKFVFKEWTFICVIAYLLSIAYDVYFKRTPLFGNMLMALLTSLVPAVMFFYTKDCIAVLNNIKIEALFVVYIAFPFLIIVPRELSLDISDIEGDKADGCRTLPILIGEKKSKTIVVLFLLLTILLSVPAAIYYNHLLFWLITIDVMLLVYIYKLYQAQTRTQYIVIGRFLWFIMIFGLLGFTFSTIW